MKKYFTCIFNIILLVFVLGCDPITDSNEDTNNYGNNTGNTYNTTSTNGTSGDTTTGWTTANDIPLNIPTATIVLDGNPTGWNNIAPLAVDMQGDNFSYPTGSDLKAVYAARDNDNLYIRADLWANANVNFGNGPFPYNGSYRFHIISNSYDYRVIGVGVGF